MKRVLGLIAVSLCLFTFSAKAADIDITNVEVDNKTHYVDELSNPTIDGSEINYNLKFLDYQQYIVYKVTLKNNTSHDYNYELKLNESNIIYELLEDDGLIESKSSKDILLKVNYKDEIDENLYNNDTYNIKDNLQLLLTGPGDETIIEQVKGVIEDLKENPKTGRFFNYGLVLFFIIGGTIVFIKVKKVSLFKYYSLIILLIIPMIVYATGTKTYTIDMNLDIEVNKPTVAIFTSGYIVTQKMHELSADYNYDVVSFKRSYELNNSNTEMQETDEEYIVSDYVINMWYSPEDKTMYYYSDAIRICMGKYASGFFSALKTLQYIDDIKTDYTIDMSSMFKNSSQNLESVSFDLSNWNMRKVRTLYDWMINFGQDTKNVSLKMNDWVFDELDSFSWSNDGLGKSTIAPNYVENIYIEMNNWTINSNVNAMNGLFYRIGDNSKNVTIQAKNLTFTTRSSMNELFYSTCAYVNDSVNIDLSGFKALNATDLSQLFLLSFRNDYNYSNYSNNNNPTEVVLNVSDWEFPVATDANELFMQLGMAVKSLEIIGLGSWDTSNLTNISKAFYYIGMYANEVKIEGLENWDVSNVTNMWLLFKQSMQRANNVYLDLSAWDTSNVTNMTNALSSIGFYSNNVYIDISNWDLSSVTDCYGLIIDTGNSAKNITIIAKNLDFSKFTDKPGFSNIGNNADNVTLDFSNWKLANYYDFIYSLGYQAKNVKLDLSGWDLTNITQNFFGGSIGNKCDYMEMNLSNWKVSSNTAINRSFQQIADITGFLDINMSNWDLTNTTSISEWFYGFMAKNHGTKINVSGWDTSNITNMSRLFYQSYSSPYYWVTYISWTESQAHYYEGEQPNSFEIIGIDEWDTSSVTDMSYMFSSCFRYFDEVSIDLSSWDISNVTNMESMFSSFGQNNNKLTLNLTGWDLSGVDNTDNMFSGIGSNTTEVNVTGVDI